MRSTSFPCGR